MRALRPIVGVILLAVAGCSALPRPDTVDSLTRPAITEPAAAAVVKHYNEVGKAADARLSAELVGSVEAGDLLRQTEAAYKVGRLLRKPAELPSTFTAGSVGAPEYGGYPMRFVASGNKRLGVWERASAGVGWQLTVAVARSAKVPDLKGLRDVLPTSANEVTESPSVAAAKFADLLTVGAKSPYAGMFAATPELSKLQKGLAESHARSQLILGVTDTFTLNAPPAAFRTASGEVLAFFTLTDANVMRPQYGAMWPVGQDTAAFSQPNHLYRNALTMTLLYQVALAIPAKTGTKIQLLGFTRQLVDSGGY